MPTLLKRVRSAINAFRTTGRAVEQKNFPLPIVFHVNRAGAFHWSSIDYESYAKEGYTQNAVVYGAIKYKLDAIAQAPMRVYEGHPDHATLSEDLTSPLSQLALRPNEYMSRVEFMQYCIMYFNLHGNCFIYKVGGKNRNDPMRMYPLRPDHVKLVPKTNGANVTIIGYVYAPNGVSADNAVPILQENMLHIKVPHPYDPYEGQGYGLSPLSAAAQTVDTDNYMTRFLGNYFANDGINPGGVIEIPYEVDGDEINKLRAQFEDLYGGAQKWGKPIVIDNGAKFNSRVPSINDMGFESLDLRNIRRSTVVFGVPARLIGLDEANSTYNNISEAKEDFWQRTMYAELLMFEEEFRHKLRIPDDNKFLRFDLSGIPAFAEDTTSQIDNYIKLVTHFVPPNEAARVSGLQLSELEYGNVAYMPVSLTVASDKTPTLDSEPEETAPQADSETLEGDMSDVPTPQQERETASLTADVQTKMRSLSMETKDRLTDTFDRLASEAEADWQPIIVEIFERQKNAIMRIFNEKKSLAKKQRKNFDMNDVEIAVRVYLLAAGVGEVEELIVPVLIKLIVDTRRRWRDELNLAQRFTDFDLLFMTRASIEGEAWFAGYVLKFAREINQTTMNGIHAVLRDGLDAGYGTDKIGKRIELLFDQYMSNNTSPEDWEFMQERMPPYRTEMIARTETHGAMSYGNHGFFKRIGVPKKQWWATADARTRASHLKAWQDYSVGGSIGAIPLDEKFYVGGAQMMHPGDKSAPLREFINCRCLEMPVFPEDEE